jgi:hypothetical protein
LTLGDAVGGGTSGGVLYVDGSDNLGEDYTHFTWNDSTFQLVVFDGTTQTEIGGGTTAGYFNQGSYTATLGDAAAAAYFSDGSTSVQLCNGTDAISVTSGIVNLGSGDIAVFGGSPVGQQPTTAGHGATAGALYTGVEQNMLQDVFDALEALNLMA